VSAVAVVVPTLGPDVSGRLLERALPPLFAERERRGGADEIVLVDDSGQGTLAPWVDERFARRGLRVVTRAGNGGFAAALHSGIVALDARRELVFALNSDVVVRPGFLEPLLARMQDTRVFAVVPRVLLDGVEGEIESLVRLCEHQGCVRVEQPALRGHACTRHPRETGREAGPVPFAVGGAFLFRAQGYRALGGFDPLFAPFYLEDLDLCWRAWQRGGRVLYEPESVVEHHHRATIGALAPPGLVRAAIEKNLLLFQWKHQDERAGLSAHVEELRARAVAAHVEDRREELEWLALALEQRAEALALRARGGLRFAEILAASEQGAGG
jgi:GT2 family glycosyltransferase